MTRDILYRRRDSYCRNLTPGSMNCLGLSYDFIAYIIMIANVAFLTSRYLAYHCETNSAPYFPVTLKTPRFSLCFDLLDLARSDDRNMTWLNFNLTETFDEIFASMPQPGDFIASCSYRNFTLDMMVDVDDSIQCTDLLRVSRYKMQGFLCYRFELFDPPTYSYHTVINSLYQPRELYSVTLQGPITQLNIFYPMLHIADYPHQDRAFERDRYKKVNSMYHLVYGMYESYSLPAPYETKCIKWSILGCFQMCIDLALEPFGLASDSSLIVEESSQGGRRFMPIGHNMSSKLDGLKNNCYIKCSFDACSSKIVATSVSPPYESAGKLKFVIEGINRPVSKIEETPKLFFADFMTQVCSVIGIWVGINFTSITGLLQKPSNHAVFVNVRINLYFQSMRKLLGQRMSKELTRICEKPRMRGKKCKNARSGYVVWRTIIVTAVAFLFAWQVFNSSNNYFSYPTTIRFANWINSRASAPVIAICLNYGDALGFDQPAEVTESNYDQYFRHIDSKINKSFTGLFAELDEEKVIAGCSIRNWTDRLKSFIHLNQSQCLKHFKLKKFYLSQRFCYEVRPRMLTLPVYQSDIRFLLVKPSVIYTIEFGSNFTFKSAEVFSYLVERFPGWKTEPVAVGDSSRKREVSISNRMFVNYLLEAPYDTNCNPVTSLSTCYIKCLNDSIDHQHVPFLAKEDRAIEARIFSYTQLSNPAAYKEWRKYEEMCEAKCQSEKCQNNFTTTAYSGEWPVEDNILKVSVQSKSSVVNVLVTVPVMLLYDLLYQIMCCFSFWYGFSLTAINPVTVSANTHFSKIESYAKMRFIILKRLMKKLMPSHLFKRNCKKRLILSRLPSCKQFTCFLIRIVAGLGCFAHLAYSMKVYLAYPTFIDVSQTIEPATDFSLTMCLDMAEMFARDEGLDMNNLTNVERTRLLNRTVTEIFASTPDGRNIIQGCSHWGLTSRRGKVQRMQNLTDRILFYTRNASTCQEHYYVQRMMTSSLMCYQFVPRNFTDWTMRTYRNVLRGFKTYFTITVNASLITRRFSLLVGLNIWQPVTSSEFAPNFFKDPKYNQYFVTYIKYVSSFLPTPYPNKDFLPFMFDRCLSECVNGALEGEGKAFSRRFVDPQIKSNITYINMVDRQKNDGSKKMRLLIERCEKSCVEYNAQRVAEKIPRFPVFVPAVGASPSTSMAKRGQVLLQLIMTKIPVFYVTFKVKISLFEQIINLGSIISIWFGFSAISLAQVRRMKREITSKHFNEMDEQLRLLKTIYGLVKS